MTCVTIDNLYPEGILPCPTWELNQKVNLFLRRTVFDNGWTRQRRRWPDKKSDITLTFVTNTRTFSKWQNWVMENGHDWFLIDLDRFDTAFGDIRVRATMRFTSPAEWQYLNHDTIRIQIGGELNSG